LKVLADGCFDPLHEGHIAYLFAARKLGSELIVNVASDEEIWRKRPSYGPFLPEKSRIEVIKALKPVDDVLVLETLQAIKKIRPDIFAKGKDYEGRLPSGEESLCRSLGIKICYLDTVRSSSTELLRAFEERSKKKGSAR
jgi:D-beta-D-heptose 7-phosphate kinase / D-beta-D-heptose 1-phosphate adenosyltransferase